MIVSLFLDYMLPYFCLSHKIPVTWQNGETFKWSEHCYRAASCLYSKTGTFYFISPRSGKFPSLLYSVDHLGAARFFFSFSTQLSLRERSFCQHKPQLLNHKAELILVSYFYDFPLADLHLQALLLHQPTPCIETWLSFSTFPTVTPQRPDPINREPVSILLCSIHQYSVATASSKITPPSPSGMQLSSLQTTQCYWTAN